MSDRIDRKLLIVFIAVIIQVLAMSYLTPKGGMTADSKNYLNLAQNILDGNGLFVRDVYSETGRSYFAVWPAGYGMMIAAVGAILPVDLLLASKIVNLIMIGLVFLLFQKIFEKEAYLYGSLFLLDTMVKLTHRTWVQTPFIAGFIFLAFALYFFYHDRKSLKWPIAITLSCIFMFMMRYVSLAVLVPVGLLGCYMFYKKDYRSFFVLAAASVPVVIFAAVYFYYNQLYSGHMTGMERIDSPEDTWWMIKRLIGRLLEEFKIPLIAASLTYLSYKLLRKKPEKNKKTYSAAGKLWPFFLLTGLSYLIILIILRFLIRFDDFGGRELGPASLLLMIALLDYLHANSHHYRIFRNCLLLVLIASFVYNVVIRPVSGLTKGNLTYPQYKQKLEKEYSVLEPNSIVLFGRYDLIYLRPDVQIAAPFPYYGDYIYGKPYDGDFKEDIGRDEALLKYVKRRCELPISAIYMDVSNWKAKTHGGYDAVQQFVAKNQGKTLVKMADCRH